MGARRRQKAETVEEQEKARAEKQERQAALLEYAQRVLRERGRLPGPDDLVEQGLCKTVRSGAALLQGWHTFALLETLDGRPPLTDRQGAILEFIREHLRAYKYAPSLREIGTQFGIDSTNAVNDHLLALERKGYLKPRDRQNPKARSIVLREPANDDAAHVEVAPEQVHGRGPRFCSVVLEDGVWMVPSVAAGDHSDEEIRAAMKVARKAFRAHLAGRSMSMPEFPELSFDALWLPNADDETE
jgi:hypothetical protein